ncbi:hypothetical protein [Bdellovibrio sp. HCB337]|uniref:hypothetical protein n=1 Tax=Bdellovibrio sp. HCB337 TaxID=3394358 RepID=UPI0039A4E62B
MKKMFLSMLVVAFASVSFAGNEGPQAAPEYPGPKTVTVLAERVLSSGFVPPGAVGLRKTQVLSDGSVVRLEWFGGAKPRKMSILTLSQKKLANLVQLINQIQEGDLFDLNPAAPSCQDAPTSSDAVYKNGVEIKIAQNADCKPYGRKNATAADARVINLLNAIEQIANDLVKAN